MADIASLDAHDRPTGPIVEHAYSIGWLQDGLDYFHHKWPWAANVKTFTFTTTPSVESYDITAAPISVADFVLDVPDGVNLTVSTNVIRNLLRWGLTDLIKAKSAQNMVDGTPQPNVPLRYVLIPPRLYLFPSPDKAYSVSVWYYSVPVVLADGAKVPQFPSDWVLVEYVRMRASEWARIMDPGSAKGYADKVIGELQAAGLGTEAGANYIPLDARVFGPQTQVGREDWMGRTSP